MTTHTCLFLLDSGQLYRYKVRSSKNGKNLFEILRYPKDEEYCAYSDDFFKKWEKDARFVKDDDVDFAFISDKKSFHLKIPRGYLVKKSGNFFSYCNKTRSLAKMFI